MNLAELSMKEKVELLLSEKEKLKRPSSSPEFVMARVRRIQELEKLILLGLTEPTLVSKNIDGGTPGSDHTSIEAIDGGTIA